MDSVWGYRYYYAEQNDYVAVIIPITDNIQAMSVFKPTAEWTVFKWNQKIYAQSTFRITALSKIFMEEVVREHVRDYTRNWVVRYEYTVSGVSAQYTVTYQQGYIYFSQSGGPTYNMAIEGLADGKFLNIE